MDEHLTDTELDFFMTALYNVVDILQCSGDGHSDDEIRDFVMDKLEQVL